MSQPVPGDLKAVLFRLAKFLLEALSVGINDVYIYFYGHIVSTIVDSSTVELFLLTRDFGDRRNRDPIYNYLCNQCLSPL